MTAPSLNRTFDLQGWLTAPGRLPQFDLVTESRRWNSSMDS
jgi:hypothetical protein